MLYTVTLRITQDRFLQVKQRLRFITNLKCAAMSCTKTEISRKYCKMKAEQIFNLIKLGLACLIMATYKKSLRLVTCKLLQFLFMSCSHYGRKRRHKRKEVFPFASAPTSQIEVKQELPTPAKHLNTNLYACAQRLIGFSAVSASTMMTPHCETYLLDKTMKKFFQRSYINIFGFITLQEGQKQHNALLFLACCR